MAHFVQYHNPDKRGVLRRPKGGSPFTFSTNKPANIRKGDTLWMITRVLDTSDFLLAQVFTVDSFGASPDGPMRFRGSGAVGTHFTPGIRLTDLEWFPAFKEYMGNFGRGLSPLAPAHRQLLERLQAEYAGPPSRISSPE